MFRPTIAIASALTALIWAAGPSPVESQAPVAVDFARDVQPIFRQSCIGCHGPTQQMSGFRLDRRRDAMRGGTIAVIGPGNSEGSRLYQRLVGSEFGAMMPPTGALAPDKVATIKAWIDQGAEWPDALAGEVAPQPPDPGALRVIAAIKRRDRAALMSVLKTSPNAVRAKGAGGVTPLMAAALDGDVATLELLLASGADPNATNDAGATALMWAVPDVPKTSLLLAHGAKADAKSADGRTPIIIAAGFSGSAPTIRLLLEHQADPSAAAYDGATPLSQAAYSNDPVAFDALVAGGAKLSAAGVIALYNAVQFGCLSCADRLTSGDVLDKATLAMGAGFLSPPGSDSRFVKTLIERGADASAKDPLGRTLLMLVAASDLALTDAAQLLIDRGVDVNAVSTKGETALNLARQRGQTALVDLLMKAGAKDNPPPAIAVPAAAPASSIRVALARSVPLLQSNDVSSLKKTGCVSCHNNTLTQMTMAAVRASGLPLEEQKAQGQVRATAAYAESWRERVLQGMGIPGDSDTISYLLIGLAAEKLPPNEATDSMARYLKMRQLPAGNWNIFAHRPPLESSDIAVTAASMRALQVYAPALHRLEYQSSIDRAATWLAKAVPITTEDRAFQLMGLEWAGNRSDVIRSRARELVAQQRADGGWSQLPTLDSDAYATGQVLTALLRSRALSKDDVGIRRGLRFLLDSQLADGSWFVKTRAIRIQPHYESGFPHGQNQFISAAATNWAAMALAAAVR